MNVTVKYSYASPVSMIGELHQGFQVSGISYDILALPETDPDTREQYMAYYPLVDAVNTLDVTYPDFVVEGKPKIMLGMDDGHSGCYNLSDAMVRLDAFSKQGL